MRNPGVIAELMVAALMEMLYDVFSYSHFSIIPPMQTASMHFKSQVVMMIALKTMMISPGEGQW